MRANLLLMLIASLSLHVGVVGTVALSYYHPTSVPPVAPESRASIAMVLRTEPTPAAPPKIKLEPLPAPVPIPVATPAQPASGKSVAASKITPSPAREINPNANVAVLPPESVLSPTPPPGLDGADGVVFLLDISGSMYEPYNGSTRLTFARQALALRIRALKDGTPFAIALYAQKACASGPLVPASDATREAALRFIMRDIDCGGGTNLPAGLEIAAQLHAGNIVLFSDGDLNMSAFDLIPKMHNILGAAGHCATFSIVGIAPRVIAGDDRVLQRLADMQGGTYLEPLTDGSTPVATSVAEAVKSAPAAQ